MSQNVVRTTLNMPISVKEDIEEIKKALGLASANSAIFEAIKFYKKQLRMRQWKKAASLASNDKEYLSTISEDFFDEE